MSPEKVFSVENDLFGSETVFSKTSQVLRNGFYNLQDDSKTPCRA